MENNLLPNPHVGEILKQEFLDEFNIGVEDLALAIGVSYETLQVIIEEKMPIIAEIDLRLCRYFGLSEGYFLRLQNAYEILEAKRKLGSLLEQIPLRTSEV
ncbi:MAG: HigA family addiction module antitoxin [Microcystaceae cyanobacterium]